MPGHFSACAISVYQALFFPLPPEKKKAWERVDVE